MTNRVSPPLGLTASVSLDSDPRFWTVYLSWRGPTPAYDKVNIAWGIGNTLSAPMPDSASLDSSPTSYTIHRVLPSMTYLFGVQGGVKSALGSVDLGWDYSDWAKVLVSTPAAPPSIPPGGREIVFYSRNGAAWMAPVIEDGSGSFARIGDTHQIGGWEGDWKQVVGFNTPVGDPYFLFYKDGAAFAAPVVMGAKGPQNGNPVSIDNFPLARSWSQIAAFKFNQAPYLLLYNSTGYAAVAPVISGANGPALGNASQIGGWEGDWTQITTFNVGGTSFFFLYRGRDNSAFVAPIIQGSSGPVNDTAKRIDLGDLVARPLPGRPATGWTQVECFDFNGSTYLLRYDEPDGKALVAPFVSATSLGTAHRIGGWQTNWAEITSLSFM
jgi:hypothetical protein